MNLDIDEREVLRAEEVQRLDDMEGMIQAYIQQRHAPGELRHAGHLLRVVQERKRRLTRRAQVIIVEQEQERPA